MTVPPLGRGDLTTNLYHSITVQISFGALQNFSLAPLAPSISYTFWAKVTVPPWRGGGDFKGGVCGAGGMCAGQKEVSTDLPQNDR